MGGFEDGNNVLDTLAQRQRLSRGGGPGPGDGLCRESREKQRSHLVTAYQSRPLLTRSFYFPSGREMIELLTAQNNVEQILGLTEKEKNRDRQQGAR